MSLYRDQGRIEVGEVFNTRMNTDKNKLKQKISCFNFLKFVSCFFVLIPWFCLEDVVVHNSHKCVLL